ncbi:MAG: hypothetical protein ACJZ86_04285 [Pontiellaceae bacterium]
MKSQVIVAVVAAMTLGAQAATNYHSGDIISSVTWKASDYHNMTNRVNVLPGATLTIEPGTVITSDGGTLAIAAGAQIFAKGTKDAPIIFTSVNDDRQNWRAACQEWGSLAIMGEGIISSHVYKNDVKNGTASAAAAVGTHTRTMEGLISQGDGREIYGGNNDDYDAGTLSYVSFRYGGQVLEEASELNGLSLGGVGRETQVDHIEIMNNVDDGIEIWGGTVCLKYISIWNIGDDSLDCDQGWRGKVQHGLIVQGYSADASQGSGVGDNCIEMDGSEDSDCEPHTTSTLYNFTVIGNSVSGDHGMALRDNVRLQVRNSVFIGAAKNDGQLIDEEADGDGASGWNIAQGATTPGSGGKGVPHAALKTVPNMEDTYGIAYNANASAGDLDRIEAAGFTSNGIYWAQTDGYMNELTDTVVYDVSLGGHVVEIIQNAYAGFDVTAASALPVASVTYATNALASFGKSVEYVTSLDPRAANDAVSADSLPTNDGFFDQVSYRGAFSPNYNWLAGWTAADEFGLVDTSANNAATTIGGVATGITFSFPSEAGITYSVQRASTANGTYSEVATVLGTGADLSYIDTTADASAFYKVVAQ